MDELNKKGDIIQAIEDVRTSKSENFGTGIMGFRLN